MHKISKEQEVIVYENMLLRAYTSPRKKYLLNSLGNVTHWLYVYNCLQYDTVTIGANEVKYNGEILATFEICEQRQMPVFKFSPKYEYLAKQQSAFLHGLDNKFDDPFASLVLKHKV